MYFLSFKPRWLKNVSELKHCQHLNIALSAREKIIKNVRDFETALKEGLLNFVLEGGNLLTL